VEESTKQQKTNWHVEYPTERKIGLFSLLAFSIASSPQGYLHRRNFLDGLVGDLKAGRVILSWRTNRPDYSCAGVDMAIFL
jgi:hypothetical protein